eukprot:11215420-Lingulodinium_polyedra.AAC.1
MLNNEAEENAIRERARGPVQHAPNPIAGPRDADLQRARVAVERCAVELDRGRGRLQPGTAVDRKWRWGAARSCRLSRCRRRRGTMDGDGGG